MLYFFAPSQQFGQKGMSFKRQSAKVIEKLLVYGL